VLSVVGARVVAAEVRDIGGLDGVLLLDISLDIGGRGGGASSKSHKFFPIAQTSSQEFPPTSRPCVLHSHAMSHARNVMPSTKDA